MSRRGALILLEGMDRSGKSTQARRLVEYLQQRRGVPVELMRFPDRSTAIGTVIDGYLKQTNEQDDHVVHLLFSANRWEASSKMIALLEAGTTIVMDRYAYSGVAFSAAKGLDIEWCKAPDRGLPAPDIVFYLDISPEVAAQRGGFGQERYETETMQANVRQAFRLLRSNLWRTIDASQSMEDVQGLLQKYSDQTIDRVTTLPISYTLFGDEARHENPLDTTNNPTEN